MNLVNNEARKNRDLGEQPKANFTPSAVGRSEKKKWLEIWGPACISFLLREHEASWTWSYSFHTQGRSWHSELNKCALS